MSDVLWREVFLLQHLEPSTRQDVETIQALIRGFHAFVTQLELHEPTMASTQGANDVDEFDRREKRQLEQLCEILQRDYAGSELPPRGTSWCDQWLPKYGCVLVMHRVSHPKIDLCLVFPDKWQFRVHLVQTKQTVHSSVPTDFSLLQCGSIDASDREEFEKCFSKALKSATSTMGAQRHAAFGTAGGHQKTPHFIEYLIRKAVNKLKGIDEDSAPPPFGGSTDVGLHTGGQPRRICWPLVCSVMHQFVESDGGELLLTKALLGFELHLIKTKVQNPRDALSDTGILSSNAMDDASAMLGQVALGLNELRSQGVQVTKATETCEMIAEHLARARDTAYNLVAEGFVLDYEEIANAAISSRCPTIEAPEPVAVKGLVESLQQRRDRACVNIKNVSVFRTGLNPRIEDLSTWVHVAQRDGTPDLLMLRTIEHFFARKSDTLSSNDDQVEPFVTSLEHVEQVYKVIEMYETVLKRWMNQPESNALVDVQQQSRKLLVLWTAVCAVHQFCATEIPKMNQYGVPLRWQHLDVVVAREDELAKAVVSIAKYLRNLRHLEPLFAIEQPLPTFNFADSFAQQSHEIQRQSQQEDRDLEWRVDREWMEVESRKARAKLLKSTLDELEHQKNGLLQQRKELKEMSSSQLSGGEKHNRRTVLNTMIDNVDTAINQTRTKLEHTRQMPHFLTSPLPSNPRERWIVLFSFLMPHELNLLGQLCMQAQSALVPEEEWGSHPLKARGVISIVTSLAKLRMDLWTSIWIS